MDRPKDFFVADIIPASSSPDLRIPATVLIVVRGDLDITAASTMAAQIRDAVRERPAVLKIDIGGVHFADVAGLRALVTGRSYAARRGCTLRLTNVQAPVQRVINLLGWAGVLQVGDEITVHNHTGAGSASA